MITEAQLHQLRAEIILAATALQRAAQLLAPPAPNTNINTLIEALQNLEAHPARHQARPLYTALKYHQNLSERLLAKILYQRGWTKVRAGDAIYWTPPLNS